MPSTQINAGQFWNLYFRNAFLTLERDSARYVGRTYKEPERAQPPGGLLRDAVEERIEVSISELRAYGYLGDGRFALLTQRPGDLSVAWEAVIKQTYPYRDAAPFGKQRMSELFSEVGSLTMQGIAPIFLAILEEKTLNMVEGHTSALDQPLAALAWFLGERRERSSSKALLAIIENASFMPSARHCIHFTPVDAAFTALWKVNDKTALWPLLDLMRTTTDAGRRKLAPIFQRLLSTKELLSLEHCGDDYFRADFWARLLEPRRKFTPLEWDRYDSDSLFWEIRYLAALRLPKNDVVLGKLASDEVQTVRDTAASRRTQP